MSLIAIRRAAERRAQNAAVIGRLSTISIAVDSLLQEPLHQQAVRFALQIKTFVRDLLQKECDDDFTENVILAAFKFFHEHMPPNEMYDGDVRRVVGSFKAWFRITCNSFELSEDDIQELTDKILETAFLQIYPDHFMYVNIVHTYCKNALGFDCSHELAVQTLDTFFEILRSFQELGFDAALIRTVAPFKEWLASTIELPADHINALFSCILQTIHEIYF